MVTEERAKELEALDRRINIRKKATTVFFVLLSVVLVIYAVKIERKIHQLSQSEAVVIYKESSTESTDLYEPQTGASTVEDATSVNDTDIPAQLTEIIEEHSESGTEKVTEASTSGYSGGEGVSKEADKIFYVTQYGKKYHKSGCTYLSDSKRSVIQEEIISGGYTPCSRCIK